ncbi:MAG: MgtC/SapB family protein [Pyrinomonadaceae bacterium]
MELIWQELTSGFSDWQQFVRVVVRLIAAVVLGAAIGFERESAGKAAGLRTHMLVTLGTCVFVLAGIGYGMNSDGLSRIIQGIVTGLGFIGAGSILKQSSRGTIHGLTTAAGIWMASAVGVAVGLGEIGLALLAAVLTLIVLYVLRGFEEAATLGKGSDQADPDGEDIEVTGSNVDVNNK